VAYDDQGRTDRMSKSLTITTSTAPDISFTIDASRCISNANTFTSINSSGDIASYSWDFNGDGIEDSTDPNPSYQYTLSGTYTVKLDVTSSGGCSNHTSKEVKIYDAPPVPIIQTNSKEVCEGVSFDFVNATDDSAYDTLISYHWTVTDLGDTTLAGDLAYSFSTPGEKIVEIYSAIPGCESATFKDTITVLSSPVANFQAPAVCQGGITTFANSSNASSAVWDFGDGFTSITFSPEHLYTSPGTYQVDLTVTDGKGCISDTLKEVFVAALPEAEFQYDLVCQDNGVILKDVSIVSGADIVSWKWYVADTILSTDKNPEVLFADQGSEMVTLEVISSNGCSSTYSTDVNVLAQPEVDLDVQVACVGEVSVLMDISPGKADFINRTWFVNGEMLSDTSQTLNYTFSDPGTYEIGLLVDNSNLCSGETTRSIEVLALPELNFNIDGICENESIIAKDASQASNDAIATRSWYFDDEFIGNGLETVVPQGQDGQHTIRLEVVTQYGCKLSSSQTTEIYTKPQVDFSASNDFGVPPFSLDFTNNSENAVSYGWYVNGEFLNSDANPKINFDSVGNYNVTLVAVSDHGCKDSITTVIESIEPVVDLTVNNVQLTENSGMQSILVDVANNSNLPMEIFEVEIKLENDFTLSETVTKRINAGKSAVISLNVNLPATSNLGYLCVKLIAPYKVADVDPSDNENCIDLVSKPVFEPAYPNPAHDKTYVRSVLPESTDVTISILDLSGQIKTQKTIPSMPAGLNTFTIDLYTLEAGTYIINITHSGQTHRTRIIKN